MTTQLPSPERSDAATDREREPPDVLFDEARQRRRRRCMAGGVGVLIHTENGGRTWQRVRLPAVRGYRTYAAPSQGYYRAWAWVPAFPAKGDVIEPGLLRGAGGERRVVFYVSRNGGTSFTANLAPSGDGEPGTAYAASADDWYVSSGNELFHTADAGKRWTRTRFQVSTRTPIGLIDSLTATVGWAETTLKIGGFYPTLLLHTSDGGRTWHIAGVRT